jgi:putative methionine-R-sulfoxide reductase with GAF domain
MASTMEDDKPWKRDLARVSQMRREQVAKDIEEAIKGAPSFEEALRLTVETMKRRFARFSGVTAYVADGEDLAVHTTVDRPAGPDRVGTAGGPLSEASHGTATTIVSDLAAHPGWAAVGLSTGSAMVAPVRTEAGLWAILEVWSEYRDAFTATDIKMLDRVASALGKKTPAA